MPNAAMVLQAAEPSTIDEITDETLELFIDALRRDLPFAIEQVELVATCTSNSETGRATLVRTPSELGEQQWNELVSRLARLFASPFGDVVRMWTQRRYGADVRFVNCCKLLSQQGVVDEKWHFSEQVKSQITPSC